MQNFKVGEDVKIQDIGTTAICLEAKKTKLKLELDGEKFWISKSLCDRILGEME